MKNRIWEESSTMCFRWLSVLVFLGAAVAQTPKLGGDYLGMLGPLHLKLHLKAGGGNYQTLINDALRQHVAHVREPLEKTLRRVIREEMRRAS